MVYFMILAVAFGVGIIFAFNDRQAFLTFACVIGVVLSLFCAYLCDYNRVNKAKIETLNSVGFTPLTEEEVYNTSKAELDKMYSISTLNGMYYYNITK